MSSEQIELNERQRKAYDCTKSYILGQQIKAHLSDGRNLTGTLICIDRCKNMILTNVKEERYVNKSDYIYRITENNGSTTTSNDIHDDAAIDALAKEIRQRIIVRMKPLSDRMGYRLIGHSKVGRPSKQRLSVLVSFVAAAYVSATEKGYRRRWDGDDLPFHQILETLFCALGINASADEAIRRQQISPY